MSEFKGTPGPWEYNYSKSSSDKWISTPKGVLMSSDYPYSQTINASDDDWKLIAASVDLLRELIKARYQIEWYAAYRSEDPELESIDSAIAKALGETK